MSGELDIEGFCPMGCGRTLLRSSDGYVTCSVLGCPRPDAVSDLLNDSVTEHIVHFRREGGFTLRHPLRERLGDEEMDCDLHAWIVAQDRPTLGAGQYRAIRHVSYELVVVCPPTQTAAQR